MPSGFQQIGSEVGFGMRGRDADTGPAFLGLGSRLAVLAQTQGVGGGGLAIYSRAGQPVTVGFQSLQEA